MAESMIDRFRKQGYRLVLEEDPEKGGYTASVLEFPGCITEGETADEAVSRLYRVAESWMMAVEDCGQEIPASLNSVEASGRFSLRLPKGLHGRLVLLSAAERVSLNTLIVSMLSEAAGLRARSGGWTTEARLPVERRTSGEGVSLDPNDIPGSPTLGESKWLI